MPKHYSYSRNSPLKIEYKKGGKMKSMTLPEPMMKPKSILSKRQKDLMKKGFCFEQAHEISQKIVGK